MKKNNIKQDIITIAVVLFVMVIGFISLGFSNYKISKELVNAKNDLKHSQEATSLEIKRSEELKKQLETANAIIESMKDDEYIVGVTVTNKEIEMLAKTVWGEARGCSKIQQSAVVWCILNRVDAGWGTIAEVVTAPNQFHGYNSNFPVNDKIKNLVEDVIARWKLEKTCIGSVGRTLPSKYLYFISDGTGIRNIFRTSWNGGDVWNWNCWNPYK